MDDNYRQKLGYAHWRSDKFKKELEDSVSRFNTIFYSKLFHYPRPTGPPNTPVELSDEEDEYDSDDGYDDVCGPDEDYYISIAEGRSVGFWPYSWHGYWPESNVIVEIDGVILGGLPFGFSPSWDSD